MCERTCVKKSNAHKITNNIMKIIAITIFLMLSLSSRSATITLDFEGLQNLESIDNFYNGGTGELGSFLGLDYGFEVTNNALALIDSDAGGSGNFGGEPSSDTIMFFLGGVGAGFNITGGFEGPLSFYHANPFNVGTVEVWSGLDGTGILLANNLIPTTPNNGAPDPTGIYSPFIFQNVNFLGTAHSVIFLGAVNQIGFDNVTFSNVTIPNSNSIPEPSTYVLFLVLFFLFLPLKLK